MFNNLSIQILLFGMFLNLYGNQRQEITLQNGNNGYSGCIDSWVKEVETEQVIGNLPNTFSYDTIVGDIEDEVITVENYKFRKT